ncbi:MAG: hypothetical protein OXR82_17495 [Gammaproteobacteria bacterium]|nr:hypothetical protein [Gammaproteobacteria bacterium]
MTEREKDSPANYGGATPEEVALAVLRYRPGKKREQRREESARDEATRASRDGQESNGR